MIQQQWFLQQLSFKLMAAQKKNIETCGRLMRGLELTTKSSFSGRSFAVSILLCVKKTEIQTSST